MNINFYHSEYLHSYHFHTYLIVRIPLQNSDKVVKTGLQMEQKTKAQNLTLSPHDDLSIELKKFKSYPAVNFME